MTNTSMTDDTWYDDENTSTLVMDGRGFWYAERWADKRTTERFATRTGLTTALRDDKATWRF